LSIGDKIKGYVKKIREGNKIDVVLQKWVIEILNLVQKSYLN
jgi:predicted RNA-binding protein (virulence factor B family)